MVDLTNFACKRNVEKGRPISSSRRGLRSSDSSGARCLITGGFQISLKYLMIFMLSLTGFKNSKKEEAKIHYKGKVHHYIEEKNI